MLQGVSKYPEAAVPKYHGHGGLNNRNILSHSSEG